MLKAHHHTGQKNNHPSILAMRRRLTLLLAGPLLLSASVAQAVNYDVGPGEKPTPIWKNCEPKASPGPVATSSPCMATTIRS